MNLNNLKEMCRSVSYIKTLVLCSFGPIFFLGCQEQNNINSAIGPYDGFVTELRQPGPPQQYIVSGRLSISTERYYDLTVKTADQRRTWWLQIYVENADTIRVTARDQLTRNFKRLFLNRASSSCFRSVEHIARICIYDSEIFAEMPQWMTGTEFYIVANRSDASRRIPRFEAPKAYNIPEILTRSLHKSFDSRVEFERVLQSRLNAQHASLSLLPRISASTVLSFVVFGPLGPFAVIGDLAPFLFPSRWTQARHAGIIAEADFMGLLLLKADTAHIAEGIALTIARDKKIIEMLSRDRMEVDSMRQDFIFRTAMDLVQANVVDDFNATLIAIDRATTSLHRAISAQLRALALAMGFFNPEAVSDVVTEESRAISLETLYDKQNLASLALRRSYELRQIEHLIQAAHTSSAERHMAWMDPSGNPAGALGFALPTYLQIGYSQIRELEQRRDKIRAQIISAVYDTIDLIERSQFSYRLATENLAIQERRIETLKLNLALGHDTTGTELAHAMQERTRAKSELLDAEYAYHIAQAKLNRLLFIGPYALLNPELGRPRIEQSLAITAPRLAQ